MPVNDEPGRVETRAEMEPAHSPLSEREIEILQSVASGASNKEIAARLSISPNTVKVHIRNIFGKIGVQSRTEAALFAIQRGYVEVPGVVQPVIAEEVETDPAETGPLAPAPAVRPAWMAPALLVAALLVFTLVAWRLLAIAPPVNQPVATQQTPLRWGALADLPSAIAGPAVAVYENEILVIGGEDAQGPTAAVARYDAASDRWTAGSAKPTAVADAQAAMIGGKIYVPGGRGTDGEPVRALEIYNPRTDDWETGAELPVARSGYALVALDGKLLLFGGWDGQRYSASVFEYTPEADRWSERAAMPTARGFAAAAVVAGRVFVVGGTANSGPLSVVEAYSPEADGAQDSGWAGRASMPVAGSYLNAAVVADTILVFGGPEGTQTIRLSYSATEDAWAQLDAPINAAPARTGVAALGPLVHLIGGRQSTTASPSHLTYQAIYVSFIPFVESGER